MFIVPIFVVTHILNIIGYKISTLSNIVMKYSEVGSIFSKDINNPNNRNILSKESNFVNITPNIQIMNSKKSC